MAQFGIDSYLYAKNSPVHRMNPTTKVVAVLAMVISVAIVKDIYMATFALLLSFLMILIAKLPIKFVARRIWSPFLFILIFAAALLLSGGEGEILWSIGFLDITKESAMDAALILIRATSAIIMLTVLLATTRFDMIVKVLYDLKMPVFLLQILMFSYRYIFVFSDELENMKNSMTSKGFRPTLSMRMFSSIANMLGMLLIKSFERGDDVYRSMVAKGYTGKPTIITKNKMHAKDYAFVSVAIVVALAIHIPALVQSGILNSWI
ncbi:cobalt ECF transporter T component CbiQ [Methanimicrococcus blatticola]|uniref:Cobalt/nickel transport system permease protein n=1 Tax=Methanimicrococcus blatticola TaxID=91560 RepID=A0A484F7M0_9EURY|nr:cobalt ECF transporter T component CbiQ [Methanimicrococcus blatticola]MBZ3935045.1 cobalt ECF transporter T component CbiQ [Methanimicrococcus blatticola]MCC2508858.1 cobalt ECF transporter T component CbiQ [Methanimicrococcus blatticola]TDQ71115.1 cobalt/nickel transport system permease protein [Methanimicrococcus blatticola]